MPEHEQWPGVDRRRDNPLSKMEALTDSVQRLTAAVDKNNDKLEKIIVLENNDKNHTAAIERAFGEIKILQEEIKEQTSIVAKAHSSYDKWIWTISGFVGAVCVLWTIFGAFLSTTITNTGNIVEAMKIHMATDKVQTPEDVRSAVK